MLGQFFWQQDGSEFAPRMPCLPGFVCDGSARTALRALARAGQRRNRPKPVQRRLLCKKMWTFQAIPQMGDEIV